MRESLFKWNCRPQPETLLNFKTLKRSEFTYEWKVKIFSTLILLLLFQLIKIRQCCGFTITNYFFFLTATNARATNRTTSNARIIACFCNVLIWFYHSLMEINSTHLCLRSKAMCYIATRLIFSEAHI